MAKVAKTQNNANHATEQSVFEFESHLADTAVIKGVKLLGLRSKNRRNYDTPGVRRTAPELLSGAHVYIDHPNDPAAPRSYRDKFGVVENYRYVANKGHFGDLKYNPKHPLADQFLWDVQNNPTGLGMSINARFKPGKTDPNGDVVVEQLEAVRSVDIVCKPGTAQGIFESDQSDTTEDDTMSLTVAEIKAKHPELLEELKKDVKSSLESETDRDDLKKQLDALKAEREALEQEKAKIEKEKLSAKITDEFTKLTDGLEWVNEEVVKEVVECACGMTEEARGKFKGVIEKLVKSAPAAESGDDDEDSEVDTEEQDKEKDAKEEETPLPKSGKNKGKGYTSMREMLKLKK